MQVLCSSFSAGCTRVSFNFAGKPAYRDFAASSRPPPPGTTTLAVAVALPLTQLPSHICRQCARPTSQLCENEDLAIDTLDAASRATNHPAADLLANMSWSIFRSHVLCFNANATLGPPKPSITATYGWDVMWCRT
jgi:hypothetical protein